VSTEASAQVFYGSVVGTVEDPTGAIVPAAKVSLTSRTTGLSRETDADEAGRYTFPNVLPGNYDLKVSASGFRTVTRSGLEVTATRWRARTSSWKSGRWRSR
jgi:hypothetical protein